MSAADFRSKSWADGSSVSSLTPGEPSAAAQGDVLIYALLLGNAPGTLSAPSGWTALDAFSGTGWSVNLWWIRRGASAPAYQSSWVNAVYAEAFVLCYEGALDDPVKTSASGTSNPANPNPASISALVGDRVTSVGMGWLGLDYLTDATPPSGYAARIGNPRELDAQDLLAADKAIVADGTEDPGAFSGIQTGSTDWCATTIRLRAASAGATLIQSEFRFRNDDGSETTATWAASQDAGVTAAVGTTQRLRVLVDATNDPGSAPYQLQYKKSTDTDWKTVM
jgi:hypothetical protein